MTAHLPHRVGSTRLKRLALSAQFVGLYSLACTSDDAAREVTDSHDQNRDASLADAAPLVDGSVAPLDGAASAQPSFEASVEAELTPSSGAGTDAASSEPHWQLVAQLPEATLLSVHGQSADDVWIVGANDGNGPVILHWNGSSWRRLITQLEGVDLWWVQTLPGGAVLMAGSAATVLKYELGRLVHLQPPGLEDDRVWGVWGSSTREMYAVGSSADRGGFIWHYAGGNWSVVPLPGAIVARSRPAPGMFKVWGAAANDIWVAGDVGSVLRGNARDGFSVVESGVDVQLVGIHGNADHVWFAGGGHSGVLLEWSEGRRLLNIAPVDVPVLQGVSVEGHAKGWASGFTGVIYRLQNNQWELIDTGFDIWPETLHSLWQDPDGGVWTVGGNAFSSRAQGLALYYGPVIPSYDLD